VTSATTAHSEASQDEEDHCRKSEPKTWSSDGIATETEVAHLVLEVGIEGNVDGKRDEGKSGSEEGEQGGDKRNSDVLRERKEQGNERNTTSDRVNGEAKSPRGIDVDCIVRTVLNRKRIAVTGTTADRVSIEVAVTVGPNAQPQLIE